MKEGIPFKRDPSLKSFVDCHCHFGLALLHSVFSIDHNHFLCPQFLIFSILFTHFHHKDWLFNKAATTDTPCELC